MDRVRSFIKGFSACLAAAKMYQKEHPQARNAIGVAFHALEEALIGREELIIGIIEDELVFDKEVIFQLDAMLELIVIHAKRKGIEKIYFYQGITREELEKFVNFFLSKDVVDDAQNHLALLGIMNIKVSHLTTPIEKKKEEAATQFDHYEGALKELAQFFDQLVAGGTQAANMLMGIKMVVFNIMENLLEAHQKYLTSSHQEQYHPTVVHSVHVGMLAMNVASKIGFIQDHVLEVGLAALLHDLGKYAFKDEAALAKEGGRSSSVMGAEILLRFDQNLGELPAVVAFEHALAYDLKQETSLRHVVPQQLTSLLVGICSYYDDLWQGMLQQQEYSPAEILERMSQKGVKYFSPQLLEKFFQIIGLWPVGTIVTLSDGRTAIVREQSDIDMIHPKVEIVSPAGEEKILIDLVETQPNLEITQALHPLGEGKEFVPYQ